jgi:hypothetical protein
MPASHRPHPIRSIALWREAPLAWLVFGLMLLVRLYAVWHVPVDSDEPQHLHVVWEWTQGRLPYRDFFDNHMPLFQWLCAPLLGWIGPRPDALLLMRLAQWPLTAATLLLVAWLGRRLWDARVGLWGATLIGLLPHYYLGASIEFRPDNAWALAWLATMALIVGARGWHARRAAAVGAMAGLTLVISAKTTLLAGSAVFALLLLLPSATQPWPWRRMLACAAIALPLSLLPAALVFAWFAAHGAGGVAWYCIIGHNVVAGLGNWSELLWRSMVFVVLAIATPLAMRRYPALDAQALRRRYLLLWPLVYLILMYAFWPLVPRQHWLPAMPLVGLGMAVLIFRRTGLAGWSRGRWDVALTFALALVACEASALMARHPPAREPTGHVIYRHRHMQARMEQIVYQDELRTILQLTTPADTVMDSKGESIFRQRPTWLVFESITRYRISHGLLADDAIAAMIAHATPLVIRSDLMPTDAYFVSGNYLPISSRLSILGQRLPATAGARQVSIAVPADYAVVNTEGRRLSIRVDGHSPDTIVHLSAGAHRLLIDGDDGHDMALVWAPALQRGLDPRRLFRTTPGS